MANDEFDFSMFDAPAAKSAAAPSAAPAPEPDGFDFSMFETPKTPTPAVAAPAMTPEPQGPRTKMPGDALFTPVASHSALDFSMFSEKDRRQAGAAMLEPSHAPDVLEPPNLDLSQRQPVTLGPTIADRFFKDPFAKNDMGPDNGKQATVRSIDIEDDNGRHVLIPTISHDGRVMSNADAIAEYKRTGQHLGVYGSQSAAESAGRQIHEAEAARLDNRSLDEKFTHGAVTNFIATAANSLNELVVGGAAQAARGMTALTTPGQGYPRENPSTLGEFIPGTTIAGANVPRRVDPNRPDMLGPAPSEHEQIAERTAQALERQIPAPDKVAATNDVLEGLIKIGSVAYIPAGIARNSMRLAIDVLAADVGSKVADKTAEALHASPEVQRLAGNIGALGVLAAMPYVADRATVKIASANIALRALGLDGLPEAKWTEPLGPDAELPQAQEIADAYAKRTAALQAERAKSGIDDLPPDAPARRAVDMIQQQLDSAKAWLAQHPPSSLKTTAARWVATLSDIPYPQPVTRPIEAPTRQLTGEVDEAPRRAAEPEPMAPEPDAPAAPEAEAPPPNVPFMITRAQELVLNALGYDEAAVRKMTPQEAHEILRGNRRATPAAEPEPDAPSAPEHKYASTQVNLPEETAQQVRSFGERLIPDDALAGDGRETDPHVTVLYGVKHDEDIEGITNALTDEPPVQVTLGATSVFPAKDANGADVVKIDVDSPDLRRIREKIASVVEAPGDTHPEYVPHSTLAYVRAGMGEQFAGRTDLAGQTVTIDHLTFSRPDGQRVIIPLRGRYTAPYGDTSPTPRPERGPTPTERPAGDVGIPEQSAPQEGPALAPDAGASLPTDRPPAPVAPGAPGELTAADLAAQVRARLQAKRAAAAGLPAPGDEAPAQSAPDVTAINQETSPAISATGRGTYRTNDRGNLEITFPQKPDRPVIDTLKRFGFRWAKTTKAWYAPDTAARRGSLAKWDAVQPAPLPDAANGPTLKGRDDAAIGLGPDASGRAPERPASPAIGDVPGGGDADRPAARGVAAIADSRREHFATLRDGARQTGYTGTDDDLADRYQAAVGEARRIAAELADPDLDHEHRDLLQAVAHAGGLGIDAEDQAGMRGELEHLLETLGRRATSRRTGRLLPKEFLRAGGLPGIPNIVVRSGGKSADQIRESVNEDPRFAGKFEHLSDFLEAVRHAALIETGVAEGPSANAPSVQSIMHGLLGVRPDEPWWQDHDDRDLDFNPEELEAQPASAPDEDVYDTGEAQPRLPGDVGTVRDAEVAQPRVADLPEQSFDLTAPKMHAPKQGEILEAPPVTAIEAERKDLPFTAENVAAVFGVTPEQGAAAVELADALGLDKDAIVWVQNGTPGADAMSQKKPTREEAIKAQREKLTALKARKAPEPVIEHAREVLRKLQASDDPELNDTDVLYQNAPAVRKWYYSNTSAALSTWQPKGTAAQFLAHLGKFKGAMDEAETIGLTDWLKAHEKVTRAEIQQYLDAHTIDVQEVHRSDEDVAERPAVAQALDDLERLGYRILGDPTGNEDTEAATGLERMADGAEFYPDEDDLSDASDRIESLPEPVQRAWSVVSLADTSVLATKYDQYQTPGGTNYREVLLTLPVPEHARFDPSKLTITRHRQSTTQGNVTLTYDGQTIGTFGDQVEMNPTSHAWEPLPDSHWVDLMRRRFGGSRELRIAPLHGGEAYQSPHWDEPNVLAHLRLNDRYIHSGQPNRIRPQGENLAGTQAAFLESFDVMEPSVIGLMHDDKIRAAVVGAIPVEVVNILKRAQLTPEDLFSKQPVKAEASVADLSLDDRAEVVSGIRAALRSAHARLGAEILAAYSAGRDQEILPALPASSLDADATVQLVASMPQPGASSRAEDGVFGGSGLNGGAAGAAAPQNRKPHARLGADSRGPLVGSEQLPAPSAADLRRWHDSIVRGKRTLFLEEVQSDWARAIRQHGALSPRQAAADRAREAEIATALEPINRRYDEIRRAMAPFSGNGSVARRIALAAELEQVQAQADPLNAERVQIIERRQQAAPEMPFKGNAWKKLTFKRALALAAEGGYEQIAWTTGAMQQDRYDLSKQVDVLHLYRATEPDRLLLSAYKNGERLIQRRPVTAEELPGIIGKEPAERLLRAEEKTGADGSTRRSIEGDDLKVGGQWAINLYDRELPNLANEIGKKYGVKAGRAKLSTREVTPERRMQSASGQRAVEADVHVMDLPTEMREAVRDQGLPLFQGAKGKIEFVEGGKAFIHALQGADFSTIVHELFHVAERTALGPGLTEAQRGGITDEELAAYFEWAGAKDAHDYQHNRDAREKGAKAWEQYLREGNAPTSKLQALFAKIAGWMREVYQTLKGYFDGVTVSKEARTVFDKLAQRGDYERRVRPEREAIDRVPERAERPTRRTSAEGERPRAARVSGGGGADFIADMSTASADAPAIGSAEPPTEATMPGSAPWTIRPVEFPELVQLVREWLNTPETAIRVEKAFRKPGKLGEFRAAAQAAGIRLHADLFKRGRETELAAVLAHEMGHLIDWLPDGTLKRGNLIGRLWSLRSYLKQTFTTPNGAEIKNPTIRAELQALSAAWRPWNPETASKSLKAYRNSAKELYADALSVLLRDPGRLQRDAPTFFAQFFEGLDEKPEVKRAFFELQELLSGTREELVQRRLARESEMFARGEQKAIDLQRARMKAKPRNYLRTLRTMLVDLATPITDKAKAVQKKGGFQNEDDNPAYWLQERNYVGARQKGWLEREIVPIREGLDQAGVSWEDFGKTLFHERVMAGDRSDLANPGGYSAEHVAEMQQALEAKLTPQQRTTLQAAVGAFRTAQRGLMKEAFDAGLLTPQMYEKAQANPAYAAFQVIEHMDDHVNWQFAQQKGTLKDIANPADATVLKMLSTIRAIERQHLMTSTVDMLARHFPDEIQPAETLWDGTRKAHVPVDPKDRDLGLARVYRQGKLTGYYVDQTIASALQKETVGQNQAAMHALNLVSASPLFRPLFTTYNLGFQTFNVQRDFRRFWMNTPGLSLGRAMKEYYKALPVAKLRAFGISPEAIGSTAWDTLTQLEEAKVLGTTYNDLVKGREASDTQIEDVLARHGVERYGKEKEAHPVAHTFIAVRDWIKQLGDFVETLPKVAAANYLRGDLPPLEMPPSQRAFVRQMAGSPDFLTGGTWTPATNKIFLYSNAAIQGMRADMRMAMHPGRDSMPARRVKQKDGSWRWQRSASGVWWKRVVADFVPKILMWGAIAGYFGEEIRKSMQASSEYDRTNYTIIPLGDDGEGHGIILRVPGDEFGRLQSGLFWKALRAVQGEQSVASSLSQILDYASGSAMPSMSPAIQSYGALGQMVTGRNPYDDFRGRSILSDDEQAARGTNDWPAWGRYLTWEFSELGGDILMKIYPDDKLKPETTAQFLLRMPIVSPLVARSLKISNIGETEAARAAAQPVKSAEAARRLREHDAVQDAIKQFQQLPPGQQTPQAQAKAAFDLTRSLYATPEERKERADSILRSFRLGLTYANADPLVDALGSATTANQKLAVLETAAGQMPRERYQQFIRELVQTRVISRDVALRALQGREAPITVR